MTCALAGLVACSGAQETPLDQPLYPTGLALHPDGNHLFVVSSDQDLRVQDGALLVADLRIVRDALAKDPGGNVDDAYVAGVTTPPFGDRPVLTSDGARAILPLRGQSRLASIDWKASSTSLSCDPATSCGEAPRAIDLPAPDPFAIAVLDEEKDASGDVTRVTGALGLLAHRDVLLFNEDPARDGASFRVTGAVGMGEDVAAVRALAVRPATANMPQVVFATADLDQRQQLLGALLIWFEPKDNATVRRLSLTGLTGSVIGRDLLFVPGAVFPGDAGAPDSLFVTLRSPDAIARFAISDTPDGDLRADIVGIAPACRDPGAPTLAPMSAVAPRIILACQGDDVVEALDPWTLTPTDALRFEGRTPYHVVVNSARSPAEIFVSFFADNSVGVFGFDNNVLTLRGRIGTPLPRPEDGRQ